MNLSETLIFEHKRQLKCKFMAKSKHRKFKAGKFLDVFAEHSHLLREFARKFDDKRFPSEEDFNSDVFKELAAEAVKTDPNMVEHLYRAYDISMDPYGHESLCAVIKNKGWSVDDSLPVECLAIWLHNYDQDQFNFAYDRMNFNHLEKVTMYRIEPPEEFDVGKARVTDFAPQTQIDAVSDMLRNMGTAAWGAFPQGTDLQMVHGSTPGVAGASEPTERLMYLADRACDLIFLGQTLTSQEGSSGSYALGSVHREVELDLYENYAAYVIDVMNNQFIPAIVELNWGNSDELPFLEVELNRPEKDKQIVERDKTLFVDMGLPVSKQWLYDRHKVPAPGPEEDLFNPQIQNSPPSQGGVPDLSRRIGEKAEGRGGSATAKDPAHADCVHATSESDKDFRARKAQAQTDFSKLLQSTDLKTQDLVWTSGDCPVYSPLNGTNYPAGWTTPPPIHHNCDCEITVEPKNW
jgi:hypothetical protein